MKGTSFRKSIIKKNITKKNLNILDVGCGPAEILDCLPVCNYYGFDIDRRSIKYAKKKYFNKRHHFFCKELNKNEIKKLPKFDYIILFGIIHHLNNKKVCQILNLCKKLMKKNSKMLTEDPILIDNQNILAKFFISKDRGLNVRNKEQYLRLLKTNFNNLRSNITHQFFPPYTWFTTICKK